MTSIPLAPEVVAVPQATDAITQADPFRYGWRYLQRTQPDGTVDFEQVPLTLDDVMHPEEDDFIVQTYAHELLRNYLADVFRAQLAHDPSAVILSDCRIAWDVPEVRPYGPDIAVIFGVREQRNWSTFNVAAEGVRPALVIEVTSPTTRRFDLADKIDGYDIVGVALYVIVDIVTRHGQQVPRLLGYRQTATVYAPLIPNERGWLWLEPVNLWLGVQDSQVACYDAAGNILGDYTRVAAARDAAESRAEAAESRAEAEAQARREVEARLRTLEAELRQLRGEQNA